VALHLDSHQVRARQQEGAQASANFPRAEAQAQVKSQVGAVPAPASYPLEGERALAPGGAQAPVNFPPEEARASHKVAGGVRVRELGAVQAPVNCRQAGDLAGARRGEAQARAKVPVDEDPASVNFLLGLRRAPVRHCCRD
jgi:hypothetical protein